tara:strand:+ start:862 stop:1089 length:228 start_codon:yes stop_codon:yes gene_type:complete
MALTRDFKETVRERAQSEAAFRVGLLTEADECRLNDEVAVLRAPGTGGAVRVSVSADFTLSRGGPRRCPARRCNY